MTKLFVGGSAEQNSNDELFTNDQLQGMGSAITSEQGTLAWCEAYALGRTFSAALNFIELMGNQLSPNSISIFGDRFAAIYGLPVQGNGSIPVNLPDIQTYIGLKQAVFGTLPNEAALNQYLKILLGQCYIDIEYVDHHVQDIATRGPLADGYLWTSPLSTVLVRVWQPRDNQDNFTMDNATFQALSKSHTAFTQEWLPADIAIRNLELKYKGNFGHGGYAAATNVINASATFTTITGVGTTFIADFPNVPLGFEMPIEVVDDTGALQTYFVIQVVDDTHLVINSPILNNISNRSYRILGIQMDTPSVLDSSCFNQ